jgi:hypothetical protein
MPGPDPGIYQQSAQPRRIRADGRVKPGHDDQFYVGVNQ